MNETGITLNDRRRLGTSSQYWSAWACYFAVLLVIAIIQTSSSVEVWGHNLIDAARETGYGDPNSFAAAAMDISSHGWVTENTSWTFNLWPPGFVLLEAGFLALFGSNAPMPMLLLILSAGMFATIMLEMRRSLADSFGQWAWLMPLLIFCFAEARISLISPIGLLFGEWLAIGSFFLAVLLLMRRTLQATMLAGMLFAVAAYARSQFEFFLGVMLLVSIGITILALVRKKLCNRSYWETWKLLLISLVIAQVLMLPWRLYHLNQGHDLRWVYTGGLIIEAGLSTDAALQEKGAGFLAKGGINVACHIAPEHCGKTDRHVYLGIFLEHPYAWIKRKVQLLPSYWFAPASSITVPNSQPDLLDVALKSALLVCLVGALWFLWIIRNTPAAPAWIGISLGLMAAHGFIIAFSHFEVRYFFFIKIYSLFSFLILLSLLLERTRLGKVSSK